MFALGMAYAIAGPNACPAAPALAITNCSRLSDGSVAIGWSAETNSFANLFFIVQGTATLGVGFTNISSPISETSALVYTHAVLNAGSAGFYRVAAPPAFTSLDQSGAFSAYAATNVNGLHTVGYAGAVFDGHYVYFVPYKDATNAHGRVLRYDTQASFTNAGNWTAYDASNTGIGGAVGYTGGVFDGHYVYFSPQGNVPHGRVLRYDTQLSFLGASSWSLYDAGATDGLTAVGFQGAVFDGRFIYF